MHKDHTRVLLGECPSCGHELRMHSTLVAGSPYWHVSEVMYSCSKCGYVAKMSMQTVARFLEAHGMPVVVRVDGRVVGVAEDWKATDPGDLDYGALQVPKKLLGLGLGVDESQNEQEVGAEMCQLAKTYGAKIERCDLKEVYELSSQGKVDAAIDVALAILDSLLYAGRETGHAEAEAWLGTVDVGKAHPDVVVAILMYVRYMHSPNRAKLLARFKPVLEQAEGVDQASIILQQVEYVFTPMVSPESRRTDG